MSERPLRVFLNDTVLSHRAQRGVSRVFHAVAGGVAARWGENVTICTPLTKRWGAARMERGLPRALSTSRPPRRAVRVTREAILKFLADRRAALLAARARPDVIYSPYYAPLRTPTPQVFTVYDMIGERFPEFFDPRLPEVRRQRADKMRALAQGAMLAAISESTARDIREFCPQIDSSRIVVTPLGVDDFFFAPLAAPLAFARPFLLFVGHRGGYKNFLALLDAFAASGLAHDFDLRVLSASDWTADESAALVRHDLERFVHLTHDADEETLRAHYAGARVFCYPSLYEGFGLPILEAMASGTLVVTANASSLPEAGGESALYFEPSQPDSLTEKLTNATGMRGPERERRLETGRIWAREFTWARFQNQICDALIRATDEAKS